jgi:phosphoenolpyruvate carboxylase
MSLAAIAPSPASAEIDDKDRPLRDDIRLLGRILGDTVREQEGEEVFALVEQIRQASIRFHRNNEVGARRELEATLDSLNADQTLAIVRAYSYFSHLANIAEDEHPAQSGACDRGLAAPSRLARLRLSTHPGDGR